MRLDGLARFILLPDLIFIRLVSNGRGGATYVCATKATVRYCPRCACECSKIYDHRVVKIKDAPIRGKHIKLVIKKRRLSCKKCHKIFMEPLSGISTRAHTTQRFKTHVLWATENYVDLEKVKRACDCSDGYLYKAVYEMLELERRKRLYPWPTTIGIDEHSFRRYKKGKIGWVTGIVDFKNHHLYEVVEGKTGDELNAALHSIPGRERVGFVCMDMSGSFRPFVLGFFPNAQIIADKFHVIGLFFRALNRKRIEVTGDKRKNPIRTLLLRNKEELEDYEAAALRQWLKEHAEVNELYHLKEAMRGFYRIKGYSRARRVFKKLTQRMAASTQLSIRTMRGTLISWRREILAYFKTGLTNAMSEGFNNKAKLLQRRAFGLRSFEHYRLRLLNDCA